MINIKIKFKPEVLMDKRFQIVTDSSCDLPQAMADELDQCRIYSRKTAEAGGYEPCPDCFGS